MSAVKAADDIRNLATKFRQLIELGNFLEGVANLEQLAVEANRTRDAAVLERDTAVAAAVDARKELDKLKQAAKELKDHIEQAPALVLDEAKAEAAQIVAKARDKADKLLAEATARKQSIDEGVAAANDELTRVTDAAKESSRVLDDMNQQIAELRTKFQ